jgi:1-acyl-sn-glycerol-3-phosphate acyltransferase
VPGLKPQVYLDERPAACFDRFHAWARGHEPDWVYLLARVVLTPLCVLLYRLRARGRANVPRDGPVLLAPNHFSMWDHFFCGVYLRRRLRFMAKSQLYANRQMSAFLTHAGAFPVRRGQRDEEAIATALAILARGGAVVVYPTGGRSRDGTLGTPRPGIGRLALETGAPVVPVAIHGSLGIRHWERVRLPRVTIEYGSPLPFPKTPSPDRAQQQEAAERVFSAVRAMYEALDADKYGSSPGEAGDAGRDTST